MTGKLPRADTKLDLTLGYLTLDLTQASPQRKVRFIGAARQPAEGTGADRTCFNIETNLYKDYTVRQTYFLYSKASPEIQGQCPLSGFKALEGTVRKDIHSLTQPFSHQGLDPHVFHAKPTPEARSISAYVVGNGQLLIT